MNPTMTSWPMRGIKTDPHCLPANNVPTRSQQELSPSFFPARSQWNCTFTRPYLSQKISSPRGPTHARGLDAGDYWFARHVPGTVGQRNRDTAKLVPIVERQVYCGNCLR